MGHETGDMRVYCHEALHLQDKMQTSGYKAGVEKSKWDTDSDSEDSAKTLTPPIDAMPGCESGTETAADPNLFCHVFPPSCLQQELIGLSANLEEMQVHNEAPGFSFWLALCNTGPTPCMLQLLRCKICCVCRE